MFQPHDHEPPAHHLPIICARVQALALHLLALDRDDQAYLRYHAWRARPWGQLQPAFRALVARTAGPGLQQQDEVPWAGVALEPRMCGMAAHVLALRHSIPTSGRPILRPLPPCLDPRGDDIALS